MRLDVPAYSLLLVAMACQPAGLARADEVTPEQRRWWAFQPPLAALEVPSTKSQIAHTPIDAFVQVELEKRGLRPAAPADRVTLLRRVTFDLAGLPPTPDEVDAFVNDRSPGAFARVVERLLASPAYGQRWARHWLDVVRYADYHDGNPKARNPVCEPLEAWRYRDWVVDAFNRDLPFNSFITHQIAGDLLPAPDGREPYADGLVATTFLVNGAWDRGDADKEKMVSDMVDDQIDTVGKAFLGLTLGCARCHDHKYDPVTTRDYYALAGIFYSTRMLTELGTKGGEITLQRRPISTDGKEVALAVSEGGVPGGLFPKIQDVPIHVRGSYTRLGPVVPRGLPRFIVGDAQPKITTGSGRRELAAWVASKDNPLTARVLVNRVWAWHFGTGLVRTPNNFGLNSEPPSHPALLDWLAARFVEDGWSLKALHRRILLTATYQQASRVPRDPVERDPDNRWLGRFTPRRLEAEAIRDALLAVAGRLDLTPGGPATDDVATARRSLYVQTARWDRASFATLFDAANPDAAVERRDVSTVAPQALFLLNHPFALAQARHLADRVRGEEATEDGRIGRLFRLAVARPPTADEVAVARRLVARAGWADLAHVVLCGNEFVYVD